MSGPGTGERTGASADPPPRLFDDEMSIRQVAEGFLSRRLPKSAWTHEAHLATCLYLIRDRPDIDVERELPGLIRGYNAAVGGVNSDSEGYHETITQFYIREIRAYLARGGSGRPLVRLVNQLIASPIGKRDYPLNFYSRERLFSVEARHSYVAPDLLVEG